MEKTLENERIIRAELLEELGMQADLCERIRSGEFVLLGMTMEPKPTFRECERIKKQFEEETGSRVLMGLLDTLYGEQCFSLIFVSQYEAEWKYDRKELAQGVALAKVYNLTDQSCEMGTIRFKMNESGYPVRVE